MLELSDEELTVEGFRSCVRSAGSSTAMRGECGRLRSPEAFSVGVSAGVSAALSVDVSVDFSAALKDSCEESSDGLLAGVSLVGVSVVTSLSFFAVASFTVSSPTSPAAAAGTTGTTGTTGSTGTGLCTTPLRRICVKESTHRYFLCPLITPTWLHR